MTTKTEADLKGQIERLNQNISHFGTDLDLSIVHQYDYITLMGEGISKDYTTGNTKTELYWQLVLTNKVLEEIRYKHKGEVFKVKGY